MFCSAINMQIIYSAYHNVSDRMSPRFWRSEYCYSNTSSQTWLTAARPETYQNLIYSLNDRDIPPHPLGRARTSNGNINDDAPNLLLLRDTSIAALNTNLVEANGIEPMTSCLQSRRSPS